MKKKGQGIFLGLVFAIVIWIAGILFLPIVISLVDTSRTGLNCAIPLLISDGTKLLCLTMDGIVPYIIWAIISLAIGMIIGEMR